MPRLVMAFVGLVLVLGAMTQVVDPPPTPDAIYDCDAPQLDDVIAPTPTLAASEPVRTAYTAVWHRETPTGRIAIFAPFRPPRRSVTSA